MNKANLISVIKTNLQKTRTLNRTSLTSSLSLAEGYSVIGSRAGEWVTFSGASIVKVAKNQYKASVTVGIFQQEFGNTVKVKLSDGTYIDMGTIYAWGSGSYNTQYFEKTFTITKSCTASIYTRCQLCFSNGHGNVWDEYDGHFTRESSAVSLTFEPNQITPGKPTPTITFGNNSSYTHVNGSTTVKLYRRWLNDDSTSGNTITVSCSNPSNATSVALALDKYVSPNWPNQATGSNSSNLSYTFKDSDRGYGFRVTSVAKSSTNHTTSGDTVSFRLNPLPTMDGNAISTNVTKTTDSVTLNWRHLTHSYCYDADRRYRVHLQKYNKSSNVYEDFKTFVVSNSTSSTFNLSSYGFSKGDKARIYVEPGTTLEWSRAKYGGIVVTRNSIPYFSNGSVITTDAEASATNNYFLTSVKLTWPAASDAEGDTIKYAVYYKKQNANGSWNGWVSLATNITKSEYTANCQNIAEKGKGIQFGVVANDGMENSDTTNTVTITSRVVYRDTEPPAPTNIVITPNQSNEHYETLTKVSWTKAVAANNKDCVKYNVKQYICDSKSIGSTKPTIDTDVITTYIDCNISNVARGKYIIWRITSIDQFGLSSIASLDTKWCRRNRVPSDPKDFAINSSRPNVYQNVPLKWTASTDPDGDAVTYTLSVAYNGSTTYSQITSGLTVTTYTHDVSNRKPGDTLSYKIQAIDSYGAKSNEVIISNNNLVINTPPNVPVFVLPSRFVHDKRPRLLLKTSGDVNGDSLTVKIKIGSVEYNSSVNSSSFNKTAFNSNDDKIVFIPPVDLSLGVNTIKARLNDGQQDSNEISFNIEYTEPTLTAIGEKDEIIITKEIHDKMGAMISNCRQAYNLSSYSPSAVTTSQTLIYYTKFNELYTKLVETTNWINSNYPGMNRTKVKPSMGKDLKINKEIYNALLETITNL